MGISGLSWSGCIEWTIEQVAYDENLSKKGDVVVVSLNHRLNILGYLDLSAYGDKYKYSGNVGR